MKKYLLLSYLLILIDQISKLLIIALIKEPLFLVGSFVSFDIRMNSGIAFSISFFPNIIIPLLSIIILAGCIVSYFKLDWNNKYHSFCFSFIFAGAIGNLLDRMLHGAVIDFIKISAFPVFNVADLLINVGVAIFIFGEIFKTASKKNAKLK